MKWTILVLALCISGACATAAPGTPGKKAINPLCPRKLTSDKARYKCYSNILHHFFVGVSEVNFADLFGSSNVFRPWMTDDVQGRGAPGSFRGIDLNAEYLAVAWPAFLTGKTNQPPDITYFTQTGNIASFSVNYLVTDPAINAHANWTIWGYAKFNTDKNLMTHYDLDFRWYGEFLEIMKVTGIPAEMAAMQQTAIANQVCNRTMDLCTGANKQWDSFAACVDALKVKPYIKPSGRIAADCLLCRAIHSILMPFDLALHCPHVGPSGPKNGACSDAPMSDYYSFFAKNTWIPDQKNLGYTPR